MLDEDEISALAAQCGIGVIGGSLDGDWSALVRFAAAVERDVLAQVMDALEGAG